jgi:hypothetical protein
MRPPGGARHAAVLTALGLAIGGSGVVAQTTHPSSAERRLVLPGGITTGLTGSFWIAALANGQSIPRHERLLIVAADGRVLDVVDGTKNGVLLPAGLSAVLETRALDVTLVHNHPSPVGLSGSDLRQLVRKGVARIIAVGSDGSVYEAAPDARIDRLDSTFYQAVRRRVEDRLLTEAMWTGESVESLAPHVCHLVSAVLQRVRVIDYRLTPSVGVRVDLDRYRDLFERVTSTEAFHLLKALEAAAGTRAPSRGKD